MKFKRKIEICLHPEKARLLEKYVKYNTFEKPQTNPQADRLKAALKRERLWWISFLDRAFAGR